MEKDIEVKGLRKSFKTTKVLKEVDFEVESGIAYTAVRLFYDVQKCIFELFHYQFGICSTESVPSVRSCLCRKSACHFYCQCDTRLARQPVGNDIWVALAWWLVF